MFMTLVTIIFWKNYRKNMHMLDISFSMILLVIITPYITLKGNLRQHVSLLDNAYNIELWWFDNNKNSHWSISYCKSCYLKFIHTWHKNQWNWWSYREVVISFSPFIGRRSLANEGWWSSKKQKYNTEIGQTDRTSHRKKWPVTFRN